MEICDVCKCKLIDFYHFRLRSEEVRKLQTQAVSQQSEENISQLDSQVEDRTVYNTLQIIRNFVERHSVAEILEDETNEKLIINGSGNQLGSIRSETIEIDPIKRELKDERFFVKEESFDDILKIDPVPSPSSAHLEYSESEDDGFPNCDDEFAINSIERSQEEESHTETETTQTKKLSKSRPETYYGNKRKLLRNSGQAYINCKGKITEAKKMRSSCGMCRNRCMDKLTEGDRQMNFDTFYGLADVVKQRKFVFEHVSSRPPSRRRGTSSAQRSATLTYFLDRINSDGTKEKLKVCGELFKNTLIISSQFIKGILTKYAESGFADSRGKRIRPVSEAKKLAIEHVQKFPFFYIDGTMTKVQAYQLYTQECQEKDIQPIKCEIYRKLFDEHNNNFLKVDRIICHVCDSYYRGDEEVKSQLQKQFDEHTTVNKKCRDRALGRIRHKRRTERLRAERLAKRRLKDPTDQSCSKELASNSHYTLK